MIRVRRVGRLGFPSPLLQQSMVLNNTAPLLRQQIQVPDTSGTQQVLISSMQAQAGGGSLPQNADPMAQGTPPAGSGMTYRHADGTPVLTADFEPGPASVPGQIIGEKATSFWWTWGPPIAVVGGVGLLIFILRSQKRRR